MVAAQATSVAGLSTRAINSGQAATGHQHLRNAKTVDMHLRKRREGPHLFLSKLRLVCLLERRQPPRVLEPQEADRSTRVVSVTIADRPVGKRFEIGFGPALPADPLALVWAWWARFGAGSSAPPRDHRFGGPLALSKVHWVRPDLVAEITYLTWADDGLLRHTVFVGLREDKPAREVLRGNSRAG